MIRFDCCYHYCCYCYHRYCQRHYKHHYHYQPLDVKTLIFITVLKSYSLVCTWKFASIIWPSNQSGDYIKIFFFPLDNEDTKKILLAGNRWRQVIEMAEGDSIIYIKTFCWIIILSQNLGYFLFISTLFLIEERELRSFNRVLYFYSLLVKIPLFDFPHSRYSGIPSLPK